MAASTVIKHLYRRLLDPGGRHRLPGHARRPVLDWRLQPRHAPAELGRGIQAYQTRGSLHSVRLAAREFPTMTFSAQLADVSATAPSGTLIDYCLKQGSYASNVSTLTGSDVYAIKITLSIEGTDLGDSADHTIQMDDVHVTLAVAEGEPDTITVSGTVYGYDRHELIAHQGRERAT
jgi:hypothetical protein